MADVRGKDILIKVGDVTPTPATWGILEGQTSATFDGTVDFADTTAKDTGSWTTSAATTRSGNISVAGNMRDIASRPNFELLRAAWLGGTTWPCQIILDVAGNGFSGDFYVQISTTGEVRDIGKYTIELRPSGALAAVVGTP